MSPFSTQKSSSEPDAWNDLFVPGTLAVRKRALWNCVGCFALPLIWAVPLARWLYRRSGEHPAYTVVAAALVIVVIAVMYAGVRFLRFAREIRESIGGASTEQVESTLSASRDAVRTFCRSMGWVAIGLMALRLFFL